MTLDNPKFCSNCGVDLSKGKKRCAVCNPPPTWKQVMQMLIGVFLFILVSAFLLRYL